VRARFFQGLGVQIEHPINERLPSTAVPNKDERPLALRLGGV
jgi:hypothetical protein